MQGQTFRNTNTTSATANQEDINTSNASVTIENCNVDIAPSTSGTITSEANGSIVNTSTTTASATSPKTKLPKLSLTKFKGQITKWSSFWDSFESAIHKNHEISQIDKFNYLNSLLEGTALRAIQGLSLTGANYNAAIEILQDRFGRPQQIITAHMDELLKISACTGDRLASLRFVYDKISVHVRGLASLGVSSEQYGTLLINTY